MKSTPSTIIGSLCLSVLSAQAFAADKESSALEIKGRIWAQYSYDLTKDSINANGFDIYRAFLQANYSFNHTWSSVLILDAQRGETIMVTPGSGDETVVDGKGITKANLWMYLRNAYIQGSDLWPGGKFRFGIQPTPFASVVDGATKTRWLAKSLTDQGGIFHTQSAGVSFLGSATDMIKYHVMIHNGAEGLTKAGASDNGLAYGTQISLSPFQSSDSLLRGLGLSVFNEVQEPTSSAPATRSLQGTNTLAAALHFESDLADLAVEYFTRSVEGTDTKLNGNGTTLNIKFAEAASLFVRQQTGNDAFKTVLGAKSILTVGPTYALVKDKLSTALLYESKAAVDSNSKTKNAALWNWAASF